MIKKQEVNKTKVPGLICPVCRNGANKIRTLDDKFILNKLQDYYSENFDAKLTTSLCVQKHSIYKCVWCTLEFAVPPTMGSDGFYEWVTNHPSYFHAHRWEWPIVIADLAKQSKKKMITVLEVGCGSGIFLEKLKKHKNISAIGLDPTLSVVKECSKKGLKVFPETLDSFLAKKEYCSQRFDFVVAFHALEHITQPKEWVGKMLRTLKPKGAIVLSTPYSPLSFEAIWYDPLNYPPHHMTRWNAKAYREMALQFGLRADITTSPPSLLIVRTLISLHMHWNGAMEPLSTWKVCLQALAHPITTLRVAYKQFCREKVNGQTAGDIALVYIKT